MKHENWPEVGTKMYFVCEHRYYIQDRAGPVMAYCVCAGEVQGFFTGGYTEMRLVGPNPDGYRTPYYYKLSAIGQTIFYTAKEAARLAQKMTEKYERTWARTGDPPMRRTWMHLLEEISC